MAQVAINIIVLAIYQKPRENLAIRVKLEQFLMKLLQFDFFDKFSMHLLCTLMYSENTSTMSKVNRNVKTNAFLSTE